MPSRNEHDVRAHAAVRTDEPDARYVLITQCLQNDFLVNRECRLYIGDEAVKGFLLGRHASLPGPRKARLKPGSAVREGPLGVFLRGTIGARLDGQGAGILHVINIRDWHVADESYDLERRAYGAHCEAGTWGAHYVEGLDEYLDPLRSPPEREAADFESACLVVRHVHSDSIFDFRPRRGVRGDHGGKFAPSRLEQLLDELIAGTEADDTAEWPVPIYLAAIGVYSDIKMITLLAGLRTRYDLPNVAVSDTLTASATLERHIAGLDFADKLLGVEVMHGVNDLARFVGNDVCVENQNELVGTDSFTRYRSFFQEKQSVLASESERLREYVALTEHRALDTYNWIRLANRFLLAWGSAFLLATLAFSCAAAAGVGVKWEVPAITGGVSLIQVVAAFYSKPIADLQRNLTNLAVFKMILESRSLKTALGRFHLTTPQVLRELQSEEEVTQARQQVELLQSELALIEQYDSIDFAALERLGFAADGSRTSSRTARLPRRRFEAPAATAPAGSGKPETAGHESLRRGGSGAGRVRRSP